MMNYNLYISLISFYVIMITLSCIKTSNGLIISKLKVNKQHALSNQYHLNMVSVDDDYPGQTAPFGFFDPFSLSKSTDSKRFKLWRESEIKHGRLAMLAAVGMLVAENFNPLFGGQITGPAIYHFQEILILWPAFWIVILASIGAIEFYNINIGWETPQEKTTATAMLKDDYFPGNLNFDPLKFSAEDEDGFRNTINKELNNGRLAMIGAAGKTSHLYYS